MTARIARNTSSPDLEHVSATTRPTPSYLGPTASSTGTWVTWAGTSTTGRATRSSIRPAMTSWPDLQVRVSRSCEAGRVPIREEWEKAEPALLELLRSGNPRYRARALWLLTKISDRGRRYVDLTIRDKDEDIRIVGLRTARQLQMDVIPVVRQLITDPSPPGAPGVCYCAAPQFLAARPRCVGGTGSES